MRILTLLFTLLGSFAITADEPYPDDTYGTHLKAIIEAFEAPDAATIETVVREHLAEEMSELPMDAHIGFFRQMSADLGTFSLRAISPQGGGQFYADFDRRGAEPMRLLIEFDPNPPHGMIGMQPIPFVNMGRLDLDNEKALDEALRELAADNEFSGALYLEDAGQIRFNRAYGLADKRHRIANTVATRFAIGSITKAFTRLAALILVDEDKLAFEDTVGKYVPELPAAMRDSITIWHLLRHESGLTDYFGHPIYERDNARFLNVEDYLPVIADLDLDFEPGSAQRYSNAGFVLLGIVIQRAAGQSYHDFVRTRIFRRLDMTQTDFEQPTLAGKPYATGYTNLSPLGPDEGFVRENTNILPGIGTPAGTSYSTIVDLLKFESQLWGPGVYSDSVLRLFHNVERANSPEAAAGMPYPRAFSAAGGQPGENSLIISVPEFGRRVVVLSNYDERLAEDIGLHLYRQMKANDQ